MPPDGRDPDDPRGVIAEAYRMAGIGAPECRTIFLDWALAQEGDLRPAVARLLNGRPDHPMTDVLHAALAPPHRSGRRGGAAGRRG